MLSINRKMFYDRYLRHNALHSDAKSLFQRKLIQVFPGLWFPELRHFRSLPKNASILELGCGTADLLQELSKRGFQNCTGVDLFDPERARFFSSSARGVKFVLSDIMTYLRESSLTTNDQSQRDQCQQIQFDVIILMDVIEHFTKDEIVELFLLIRKKLAPGGKIMVRVPNIMSWTGKFNQYTDFTHETPFTERTLYHLLWVMGFKNIRIYSSEKWIKFVHPKKWPGFCFFIIYFIIMRCWSMAFGGAKHYTLNVTAWAELSDLDGLSDLEELNG